MDYGTRAAIIEALRERVATIAWGRGAVLGLAVLATCVWLARPYVVDADNAEFATLGALGGCAHPSGYPLYVLWLRAMSWLPGATPAATAAIATAILGAAAIVVLHAACRAWGARPAAASLACALLAGAPLVLALFSEAEVFAGNCLVCAAVLWLAAARGPLRGTPRAAVLGLVAGLGLANHLTCVLVAPVGILGVVRGAREAAWPRALAAAAAGLVLGLVPYAYLLVAPEHAASWGHVTGLGDVLTIFLRREYGGPGVLATSGHAVAASHALGALAADVGRSWLYLPALAGLAALAARCTRPGDGEPRAGWIALAASLVLAGPALALEMNLEPRGVAAFIVSRFHLLPALLLAIPVADALDRGLHRVRGALATPAAAGAIALGVFAAAAGSALPRLARLHSPVVQTQVVWALRTLPHGAVVIGQGDDVGSATGYAQLVLGVRPDVTYVQAPMLGLPWYRARLAALGLSLDGLVDDALAHGRPVLVQPPLSPALAALPHYRAGIFDRVLPRGAAPPPLAEVVAGNVAMFAELPLHYPRPTEDDGFAALVHERYAHAWQTLAAELARAGDAAGAETARERAAALEPLP